MSLFLIAVGMFGFLGMSGLALDLASFYVTRSEAQRAADAAALAGAKIFALSGCTANTTISCSSTTIEASARQEAESVGNQNMVGGASPAIVDADITFDMSHFGDPIITVNVQRTSAHGNPVPTYFGKIVKFSTVNVSAIASAEAYNQSGDSSGPTVTLTCIKPFIVANCDTSRVVSGSNANANQNCPDGKGYDSYFVDPNSGQLVNPGLWPSGAIGESLTLHYASVPGNYQTIDIGQGSGASALASAIEGCYPANFTCQDTVTLVPGKKVGPVTSSVETLIHQGSDCNNNSGQDTIAFSSGSAPPYTIIAGSNNPDSSVIGKQISMSDSIMTIPMFDGATTGSGSGTTFTITGFMQVFVTSACHSASDDVVNTLIFNIPGCPGSSGSGGGCMGMGGGSGDGSGGGSGGSGGGSSSTVSGGGASTIPIRLIQTPSS